MCDLGFLQLFDDKGHSGLLTSQMTPRWRAVRKAVASALSPQTLRCDAETKIQKICTVSASATVVRTAAPVLFAFPAKMQLFMSLHRASFPKLRTVAQRLVEKVRLHGPDLPVDMDLLCAQLSWDIIGEPSCANYHWQLTAAAKHILELPVLIATPDTVCQLNFVHLLHCNVYVNPCSAYACQQTLYCVHAGIVGFDTDMGATKET